jgi:hypothetical protein
MPECEKLPRFNESKYAWNDEYIACPYYLFWRRNEIKEFHTQNMKLWCNISTFPGTSIQNLINRKHYHFRYPICLLTRNNIMLKRQVLFACLGLYTSIHEKLKGKLIIFRDRHCAQNALSKTHITHANIKLKFKNILKHTGKYIKFYFITHKTPSLQQKLRLLILNGKVVVYSEKNKKNRIQSVGETQRFWMLKHVLYTGIIML